MGNEHGEWIIHGVDESDPNCIKSADELIEFIDEQGFIPLFKNVIPGFSVEERTIPDFWWTGDEARDPWHWRQVVSESGKVAYGKFFDKKAGFISLKWFSYFANWRREGYDFEGFWDNQLADYRAKRIMDLFKDEKAILSNEIKRKGGFGKDGDGNFEGIITSLQMNSFLVVKDFAKRVNAKGEPYGWPVAMYSTPESMWGLELVNERFGEEPDESKKRFYGRVIELYPEATQKMISRVLR